MGESDSAFHSSTSWLGSSEPHVIPKQDQPTSSEPEIDLEALMELSTEEQKTQLEVEWVTDPRPRVGGWKLGSDQGEPKNPDSASPSTVGRTSSEGKIPGRLGTCEKSGVAQGPTLCFLPPGSSPKLPPPHRGKGCSAGLGVRGGPVGRQLVKRKVWSWVLLPFPDSEAMGSGGD